MSIAVAHMSFMDLFTELKESTDERTAKTISKAFETFAEQISEDQDMKLSYAKEAALKELNIDELSTKAELKDTQTELRTELKTEIQELKTEMRVGFAELRSEFKTELHHTISSAKWQVLGGVGAMLFAGIVLKHFGLF